MVMGDRSSILFVYRSLCADHKVTNLCVSDYTSRFELDPERDFALKEKQNG